MAVTDDLEPGAVIIVHRHLVGGARRAGEIMEVLGDAGHRRYRVRWDDDRESIFFPGDDVAIEKFNRPRQRPTASADQ